MHTHSRALFSSHPARGASTRNSRKYSSEAIWPIMMKGCSTGIPPIQVRIATSATRVQKRNCVIGRKVILRCFDVCRNGTTMSTRIENRRAKTPPSLFGMERRIAYANRKYHSGLMCGGVTRGLAGVKLSGSPSRFGENRAREVSAISRAAKPRRSL